MTGALLVLGLLALNTCRISGRVLDVANGRPLTGATVVAGGSTIGTATDSTGRFVLVLPFVAAIRLEVSHVGYDPKTLTAVPGRLPRPVRLHAHPFAFAPVEVRPAPALALPVGVREVAGSSIRRTPGAEKDLFRAVTALPGVSSTGDLFGWLYVRGGTPDENLFLLDGIEVPNPYHYAGLASVFNNSLVDRVRLSTGGFGPERGDRTASVLEVTTRAARPGVHLRAGVDPTELEASAEWGRPGSGVIAALRHCYLDQLLGRLDLGSSYIRPTYTDLQASARTPLGPGLSLTAGVLGSSENASAGDSGNWRAPGIELSSRSVSAGLELAWQPATSALVRFRLSGIDSRQEFEVRDALGANVRRHWPRNVRAGGSARWQPAPRWSLEAGGSVASVAYRHESTIPLELLDPTRWGDTCAADVGYRQADAWFRAAWEIFPRVQLNAGARFDARSLDPRPLASPRLQARWQPATGTEITAAWGIYRQFAAPENRNADSVEAVQPDAALARHLVLGFEQQLPLGLELRLEGYDKDLDRLVIVEDGIFTAGGTGYARGLELALGGQMSALSWQTGYAWSQARRSWLHDIETGPADGEQPHIFNLSVAGVLPGRVEASTRLRWSSGAPYTPEVYYYENHCVPGPHNSARYPAYFRLDLRAARRFAIGRHSLETWLSVLNVTGAGNVQSYYFDSEGNQRAIHMLPRIPVLGVAWEF